MDLELNYRMQIINQMLLEMASGNFFYRIERSKKDDSIEALVVILNMLAEEIQEVMMHQGFVNTDNAILNIIQMSFIIDEQGCVEMVNQKACNTLSVLHKDVLGKQFEEFLSPNSIQNWRDLLVQIKDEEYFDTSMNLDFKSKGGLLISKVVYISTFSKRVSYQPKILVNTVDHVDFREQLNATIKKKIEKKLKRTDKLESIEIQDALTKKIRLSYEDIRIIRQGHDIIVNNLDTDFPSLKDFALQIGTNEFKLKYGFKELYGTTVHRFLMESRLRKAQMLIQYSDLSMKSIAYMIGFKSMPHFSRAFKKRYGYTPTDLRNNTIINESDI